VRPPLSASIAAGTLFAVLFLVPCTAAAQAGRGAPPPEGGAAPAATAKPAPENYPPYVRPVSKYVPPRTPDGQPNISGMYMAILLPRNIETPRVPPAARGRAAGKYAFNEPRPQLPKGAEIRPASVDPPDGKIPLQPWALEKRRETMLNQDKIEYLDGRVLCLPPGIPRTTIPAPVVGYQIMQKPGYVVIFYEQSHLYRAIPIDGRPPLHPNIRKAMGVSRGRWEGNTLVVEVTNFTNTLSNDWVIGSASAAPGIPSDSLLSGHGISHSDVYRVTERYTPIDADTIHYEATINDPKVFTQPWTLAFYAFGRAPKDYVPVEYACHEGNQKNLELMTGTDISGIRVDVP
jgi:hypothetical protein